MQLACPYCAAPNELDDQLAGRTTRCPECGKSFIAPDELAVKGQHHTFISFPVASVVLLHFVSCGMFTLIYMNQLHERMPRLRPNDPSATVALGLCFVPFVNLIWFLFSFHRLCIRIDEQRSFNGLEHAAPTWLALPLCCLLIVTVAAAFFIPGGIYLLILVAASLLPLFAALVQNAVNGLCEREANGRLAAI
ncbi:MAG: hypothetical protein R3E58_15625 [Phycisphaerae bacterium]|nr:hypothetical protein [Phycisphaerales bacterium]